MATETLRLSTSTDVEHTVVGPSTLVTAASLLVFVGPGSQNTTAIAIANPSLGTGGVNLILTNGFGGFVADATVQLGPREQFSRFLNEIFSIQTPVATPLLLTVSAELPVAILALNFQGEDFALIPMTSLAFPTPVPPQPLVVAPLPAPTVMPGFGLGLPPTPTFTPPVVIASTAVTAATTLSIGGNASLVFAQVAFGGQWSTDIAVANTSAGQQTVRIDFFSPNGVNISSLPDILIEPRGVFFFSTDPAAAGIQ